MDDQSRIALLRVGNDVHQDDKGPEVQYHLGDHLGNSNIVIDDSGNWINREEYFPYGETSFGSFEKKRYRFSNKERDAENGLYYYGMRYYIPWLARWNSCDPKGATDSLNLYLSFRANPVIYRDPTGEQSGTPPTSSESTSNIDPLRASPVAGFTGGKTVDYYLDFAEPSRKELLLHLIARLPEPWRHIHLFHDLPEFEELTSGELQSMGAYPKNWENVGNVAWFNGIPFPVYSELSAQEKALSQAFSGTMKVTEIWTDYLALKDLAQLGAGFASKLAASGRSGNLPRVELDNNSLPSQIKNLEWDVGPAFQVGDGPPAGHHLQATFLSREGSVVAEWAEVSGNVGKLKDLPYPYSTYLVHTEVKALSRVRLQPGDTLLLFGEKQVCTYGRCNWFLRAEAFSSGADILYFDVATGELLTAYLGRLKEVIDVTGKLR